MLSTDTEWFYNFYFLIVCPVNSQEFILRNRDILPVENIRTTSEDSTNNPASGFIDTTSSPWCTAQNQGTAEVGHHVELIFTESIVVEFFKSAGLIGTWVSNFSIQYSQTVSGDDFITYGVLEASQVNIIITMHVSTLCTFFALSTQKAATIVELLWSSVC